MITDTQKFTVALLLIASFLCYTFFLLSNLPQKNHEISEMAKKGKLVWQKYNCNSCHQIYGLGGYLGPDLTNITSIRNEHQIKAFIKTGTKSMPILNLTKTEIDCIIEFLKNVNSTGSSDPRTFMIQKNGTIHQ